MVTHIKNLLGIEHAIVVILLYLAQFGLALWLLWLLAEVN